jgi:putative tryptophan/tyrosine transport system substrate-binding protein
VRRRDFITLLSGAAAWPLLARAQSGATPVIGFLNTASAAGLAPLTAAFRDGLRDGGYVEGRNVSIEYRWAEGQSAQLPALTADLVGRNPNVIVANANAALIVKQATATIPTVFISGSDPVKTGLVASLNRPGGNLTGVAFFTGLLGPKRLELLNALAPKSTNMAVLLDANQLDVEEQRRDADAAARTVGHALQVVTVKSAQDFEAAFAQIVEARSGALLVGNSPFFTGQRRQLTALAARHALPASYTQREYIEAGGLMSYGPSVAAAFRQVGIYTARILKGEKPADLPVDQATRFELVINLKTAKALGLEVPDRLLALADEVIE